ncbi:hypothetical protein [Actinoplanes palleronii]|uniref:Uncharacterized protein n=1 Tax=Actinoplanes palleronii TaxID=113570 RepID=A0ABQ4B7V4_9ACTN|nr:hypothetical protein [Actinoplanes palleronii]GIE66672.1 hypothetical protein Apa02nite_027800 [Actinoplanes palleronii]
MTAPLELTYGRLLRLYPADFRRERGAEVLDTLLEMADDSGRSRPAPREVLALVVSALRMRAGRPPGATTRQSWLTAIRVGALLLIVHGVAGVLVDRAFNGQYWILWSPWLVTQAGPVLGLIALVLVARRWHLAAAVVLLPAGFAGVWDFFGAAVLLGFLVGRRPLPAKGLLRYAPIVPLLLALGDQLLGSAFPEVSGILRFGLLMALVVAGLIWLVVDERVALALGLLYLNSLLVELGYAMSWGVQSYSALALGLSITALPPALLLGLGTETARRQSRL